MYMKLEQHNYWERRGWRWEHRGGPEKDHHLSGNEKTMKTQVFSAGYVRQTTVQSKL